MVTYVTRLLAYTRIPTGQLIPTTLTPTTLIHIYYTLIQIRLVELLTPGCQGGHDFILRKFIDVLAPSRVVKLWSRVSGCAFLIFILLM